MASVVTESPRRAARLAEAEPGSLVISIGPERAQGDFAQIQVAVGDEALKDKLTRAMDRAVRPLVKLAPAGARVLTVRSDKALARAKGAIEGSLVVVPVTSKNLGRLGELVEALWESGVLGVQLAWDGRDPGRARAERRVFAVLERARSMPKRAPVVLARGSQPVEALSILAAIHAKKGRGQP